MFLTESIFCLLRESGIRVPESEKIYPGSKIGELTVVADSGKRENGYIVWHCRCSCGNEIDVEKRALEKGTVKSCGCIRYGSRKVKAS